MFLRCSRVRKRLRGDLQEEEDWGRGARGPGAQLAGLGEAGESPDGDTPNASRRISVARRKSLVALRTRFVARRKRLRLPVRDDAALSAASFHKEIVLICMFNQIIQNQGNCAFAIMPKFTLRPPRRSTSFSSFFLVACQQ